MRLGWLADPRAHLFGAFVTVGSLLCNADMARVAQSAEDRAFQKLDEFGHEARVAMGLDSCDGHLSDDATVPHFEPCLGSRVVEVLATR